MGLEIHSIASFLAICFTGMILNAFEIAALLYAKRTNLPFDITLISLAASDFSLAVAVVLFTILELVQPTIAASIWYTKIYTQIIYVSGLSSMLHMIFIAVQRLVAVLYPLKLSIWLTRKRCIITMCVIWLASIVTSVPVHYISYDYEKNALYTPLVTASAIMVCYIIISYRMITRKQLSATGGSSKQNLHVLLYSMTVTTIYIGCSVPSIIEKIIQGTLLAPFYTLCLNLLQLALNPIAYFFFHFLKGTNFHTCCRTCNSQEISTHQQDRFQLAQEKR